MLLSKIHDMQSVFIYIENREGNSYVHIIIFVTKNIENRFVVKRACNQQHLQYPMMCVLYRNFDIPVNTTNALENVNESGGLRSSQGKKMCLSGTVNTMIAMLKGHI